MKTYKEKLIELLKEVPAIKADLEELRKWCRVYIIVDNMNDWNDNLDYYKWIMLTPKVVFWTMLNNKDYENLEDFLNEDLDYIELLSENKFEIIWNPLDYNHLMMYCEEKGIKLQIQANWVIQVINDNETYQIICNIDNTKSFDLQSEETFEKLYKYFNWIKN